MAKKAKKITFTEEIDSKISGFALVYAFLFVGIFLLLYPDYFGNKSATSVVRWVFIVVGLLGFFAEASKNISEFIKGIDSIIVGTIMLTISFLINAYIKFLIVKIISFLFVLIALFGFFKGLFEFAYSIVKIYKAEKNKKIVVTDSILFLTRFASLILVIIQIVKVLDIKGI